VEEGSGSWRKVVGGGGGMEEGEGISMFLVVKLVFVPLLKVHIKYFLYFRNV